MAKQKVHATFMWKSGQNNQMLQALGCNPTRKTKTNIKQKQKSAHKKFYFFKLNKFEQK